MSNCIYVMDGEGNASPIFTQLLAKHKGDEEAALREFALNELIAEKTSFSLGTAIADAKTFLNSLFRIVDEFSTDNENSLRRSLEANLVAKKNASSGLMEIYYYSATGQLLSAPESEKSNVIEKIIADKRALKNETGTKLLGVFKAHASGNMPEEAQKTFGDTAYGLVKQSVIGLVPGQVRDYSEFSAEPWFIPGLASEKILVHVKTLGTGKKVYDFIFPSNSHGQKAFSAAGNTFIGAKYLGSNTLSEANGITVAENVKGRKQITASLLTASIKYHEPDSIVSSARFLSFAGEGHLEYLDLFDGLQNVKNLFRLPEFSKSISGDLSHLKTKPEIFDTAGMNMDYVSVLFEEYESGGGTGKEVEEFKKAFTKRDKLSMLQAVNRRMYLIMKTHGRVIGGKKEYEIADTPAGKEMLRLAKAKEQLMMKEGMDYRNLNTQKQMGFVESWVHTQGEYANAQINLTMQEVNAIEDGIKQRYKNKHLTKMQASINKFIKANGGVNARGAVLNDTQSYFKNLYDSIKVRRLDENGQYSADLVEVQVMRFKDPNDTSNNLTQAERIFIREMIELHKESLIRMMDKKINDGLEKGYASGAEWYEKRYKSQELLIPVTRKSSSELLANGEIKASVDSFMDDFTNVYNLNDQGQSNKEYIFGKYGSASSQIGGEFGSDNRLKSLGLEYINDELVLVDPNKNKAASFNIEQSLNISALNNEKAAMEMEFHTVYEASKLILLNDKLADRGREVETLKAMFENLVYGDMETMDLIKNKNHMKVVGGLRKITSLGTLSLNWKSAALATLGSNMSLVSDALAQRYGKHFFNFGDYSKAIVWASSNPVMFDKLIDLFMFHESDEVNLMFSSKYQAAQKGVYKSRFNTIMHSAGDRLVRGILLASQLHHDGLLDNFREDSDGNLIYDWTKDQRPDPVKKAIQDNLTYRGVENLPYDEVMMRSLTTISGKVMGSFTDADKARFQAHEGAKVFAQFKAYLGARLTNLYSEGFENVNIRHYEVDDKGQLSIKNYYQEGIYQSVVHAYKELHRLRSYGAAMDSLRPEQISNLIKLRNDLAIFGGMAFAYGALAGLDDDKTSENSEWFKYLKYAWLDVVGTYNMSDYLAGIGSPVMITYLSRLATASWNIATLNLDTGVNQAVNLFGPTKTFRDIYNLVNQD